MGNSAERVVPARQDWNIWRNVTDWALLSEGGYNKAPYTDGYSTGLWFKKGISASDGCPNQVSGRSKHGSLIHRTIPKENGATSSSRQGKPLFFRSGTVHFVFRERGEQTFAAGGHILQWYRMDRWIEVARVVAPDEKIPRSRMRIWNPTRRSTFGSPKDL